MPTPSNRRRTPRAICDLEAKALGPRGTVRGRLRNLSVGGMFFQGKDMLAVGTNADFEFALDGAKIHATGEIRYHHRFETGMAMGVKFLRLEPTALSAILAFVEKSPKTAEEDET